MHRTKVRVVEDALDANNTIAAANRSDFDRFGVTVVDLMSAPGAGKTTLLERGPAAIDDEDPPALRVGVLEGDVQGSFDAHRLSLLHIPVVQLNTDNGFGGECHLDANMVRSALPAVPLEHLDFDVDRLEANILQVNHHARVMRVSAKTGEGVDAFRAWLKQLPARAAAEAAHEHEHQDHPHHEHATA